MNSAQKDYLDTDMNKVDETQKEELVLLALVAEDLVNLALFSVHNGETKLYSWAQPQVWDGKDKESLVAAFEASWRLIPELETTRGLSTVFLTSPFWVDTANTLVETKKSYLAVICRQYKLNPLGFLLPDESLIHYYEIEEGGLPSFISVFVGSSKLEISLIHLGKVKSRLKIEKNLSRLPSQIEEVLNKIDFQGMFPPNLIFWGDGEEWSVELEENINNYQWVGKRESLFLHLPQISILKWSEFFSYFRPIVEERFSKLEPKSSQNILTDKTEETELTVEKDRSDLSEATKKREKTQEEESEDQLPLPEGFFDKEVLSVAQFDQKKVTETSSQVTDSIAPDLAESWERVKPKIGLPVSLKLTRLINKGKDLIFKLWRFKPHFTLKFGRILFFGVILLFLIPLANLYLVKNKVIIFVTPQVVEETRSLQLISGVVEPNIERGIFPAVKIEAELEETGQVEVTGKKMIGEKAIGTIILFNRTTKKTDFPSGTIVIADNGLEFSLRESVSVASKTADLESGVDRLGEAQVEVIATDIGPDYNLAKNTIFSVQGFPKDDFIAKAKDDFSGGSHKEVKAVSSDDLTRLKEVLSEEIISKAQQVLEKEKSPGLKIISQKPIEKLISFTPQRREDEEAETLSGSLKMNFSVLAFDEEKFRNFALKMIEQEADDKLNLNPKTVEFDLQPKAWSEKQVDVEATIKAKLYPTLDTQQLSSQLVKVRKSKINQILRQYPRIYRFETKTFPLFFSFWPWLSAKPTNILFEIKEG